MPNEQGPSARRDRPDTAPHGVSHDDVDSDDDVEPSAVDVDERARFDDAHPGAVTWARRWRHVYAIAVLVLGASIVPVPAIGVAASVSTGVNTPSPTLVFHLVGYAALAVSLVQARSADRPHLFAAAVAIGVAVGVGFGIELLQTLVPWRRFAWVDTAANATGACVGVIVHAVIRARIHASR